MEDKNRTPEEEQKITAGQIEQTAENNEEPAEQAGNEKGGLPTRSCILMIAAGLYLLYTGYRLCENVLKGVDGGSWGFFAAGAGFFIVGAVILAVGVKNLIKKEKEKRESEEKERREHPQPAEAPEKKTMSIAERARLTEALSDREEETSGETTDGEENAGENSPEE